ncbi:MAG: hypothetical protein ACE5OO_05050 [Candidatus Bathyarchaeia archaeon]
MVEVVTLEAFTDYRERIEEKLDDLIEDVDEKHMRTQADLERAVKGLNKRIDDLEESSKGFIDRLRDAFARATEPSPGRTGSNPLGTTEKTLGKVAEVIMRCPHFFDWDLCQDNCPMYLFCDNIATIQDVSKLIQKRDRLRGILQRIKRIGLA